MTNNNNEIKTINSIETIFVSQKKSLHDTLVYSKVNNLLKLIKTLRLKPYPKLKPGRNIYTKWIDEFGNLLQVRRGSLTIIRNRIINNNIVINNDLYCGLSLKDLLKISNRVIVIESYDTNENIIIFYGIDNYLRTYHVFEGESYHMSTLSLSLEFINFILDQDLILEDSNNNFYVTKFKDKTDLLFDINNIYFFNKDSFRIKGNNLPPQITELLRG